MNVNRRTTTVLAIIVVILVAVFAITRWQRAVATKKLLDDLPGDDYAKVMDAMTQLKERGHSIVPTLLDGSRLGSPSAPGRWRSATLLGDVGTKAAWEPLKGCLADEAPDVRAAAALALGKLRVTDSATSLRDLVADEEEVLAVRVAAASALGLMGDSSGSAAMQGVVADTVAAFEAKAWASHSAAKTATEAVETAKEAIGTAKQALVDARTAGEGVKDAQEALTAAQEAVPTAQTAAEEAQEIADEDRAKALSVGGRPPEQFDVEEEEEVTGEEPEAPEPPVDGTWQLRIACLRALGMVGAQDAIGTVANTLDAEQEPNAEVRTAAAYCLGDMAAKTGAAQAGAVADALVKAQEDETGDVRAAALHSMSYLRAASGDIRSRLQQTLESALSDDFYWAREAAIGSMRKLNIAVPAR